jgi:hypothetical protein
VADKVIQMQVRNASNTAWDSLNPKTKASAVLMNSGKSVEESVTTHLAETAQDNVHGLGDRPMVSTALKTYYIDEVSGSDANDGLTSATAFKTWNKAHKQIPVLLLHTYTIRIIGNLTEIVDVYPVFCKAGAYLQIRGNTDIASNHVVSGIKIGACAGGFGGVAVDIRALESTGIIDIHGAINVSLYNLNPRNGGEAIRIRSSLVSICECNFGTNVTQEAIRCSEGAHVLVQNCSGNATRYGLFSYNGAIICKSGTQPTGETANEYKQYGGQIF